jgi:hypothetical protein
MRAWLLLTLVVLGIAGCSSGVTAYVQIDYVDFVQLGGIQYVNAVTKPSRPLEPADLGAQYGTVKVQLEGSSNPNHRLQDGDAAFLAPGTALFRLKLYRPTFRLAARSGNQLVLYEADSNPKAKVGADLVNIAGQVDYIAINSSVDSVTKVAQIRDPATVARLAMEVEWAPVDQATSSGGAMDYFLDFHLVDGTDLTRAYWLRTGELWRGIRLPANFGKAVLAAVAAAPPVIPQSSG